MLIVIIFWIFATPSHVDKGVNKSRFQKYNESKPQLIIKNQNPDINNIRCPADVRQCSDGTYVGRIAPNCSFALCVK